jgi:hypothetical protein
MEMSTPWFGSTMSEGALNMSNKEQWAPSAGAEFMASCLAARLYSDSGDI